MPDNNNLSDLLQGDDARDPKPPAPNPCDRSAEDEAADSSPSFRCDPSTTAQEFLCSQRDKLLNLLQHSPPDLDRIRDLYRAHLVGQFHIVGVGKWERFWSLIDGLHALDDSFHAGSILFGGWKAKPSQLLPPSSLSDNVTAFSGLPEEFHDRLHMLDVFGEAVRLQRLFIAASDSRNGIECKRNFELFEGWTKEFHAVFRPDDIPVTYSPSGGFSAAKPSLPSISLDEIGQFVRSGRFADLQDKVEGWIRQHSHIKAFHFPPAGCPSQGWKDFRWFCRVFNFLQKPRKNGLCYYFLIQLPSTGPAPS